MASEIVFKQWQAAISADSKLILIIANCIVFCSFLTYKTSLPVVLESDDYIMLGIDLSNTDNLTSLVDEIGLDRSVPTLLFSEVAVTYMTSSRYRNISHLMHVQRHNI